MNQSRPRFFSEIDAIEIVINANQGEPLLRVYSGPKSHSIIFYLVQKTAKKVKH